MLVRRTWFPLAALTAVLMIGASSAQAVVLTYVPGEGAAVEVRDRVGEANKLTIDVDADQGVVAFVDSSAGIADPIPAGCTRRGPKSATCPSAGLDAVRTNTGAGPDTVNLIDTSTGEIVWADSLTRLGGGKDVFRGSVLGDRVIGGPGPDRLNGRAGDDYLFGGAGKDALFGGNGRDHLDGGEAKDRCSGGKGKDYGRSCEIIVIHDIGGLSDW